MDDLTTVRYPNTTPVFKHQPPTLDDLRKMRPPMRNIYIAQKEHLTPTQRLAAWVTERLGTLGFFHVLFWWTVLWLGWNMFAPQGLRFDPYPAFVLWLFISNMFQLLLLPIIMIGQNLQAIHADARAQADFELNQVAEREIETVLLHLENQNEIMLGILRELETHKH